MRLILPISSRENTAHKLKLSCLGSGGGRKRVHTKCNVDRFNNLPEGVAHHILSSLGIRDLTRFGSLSKRCRQLYLSAPSLIFDDFSFTGNSRFLVDASTCYKWLRLLTSLDGFLNRRGDNKINCFRINWMFHKSGSTSCFCDDSKEMISWIKNAIRCNVEVLDLEITRLDEKTPYILPSCVLLCGSLRSLSLSMLDTIIETPSFASFSKLERLNLTCVTLDEGFFKWISSSCNCIRELHLKAVYGKLDDITIEISSLESFTIVTNALIYDLKISGEKLQDICLGLVCECRLNIFAPNLKYLNWGGRMVNHQVGKLLYLEKAELNLFSGGDDFEKVYEVLCSIRTVKALILYKATIEALLKRDFLPAPFEDVSYLEIEVGRFSDDLVPTLVSLFRGMPNVSTLYLKSDPGIYNLEIDCSGFDNRYWKLQNLPFISQLKEITVEILKPPLGSNAIDFTTFILELAQNLKEMVIVHSPPQLPTLCVKKLIQSNVTSNVKVECRSCVSEYGKESGKNKGKSN